MVWKKSFFAGLAKSMANDVYTRDMQLLVYIILGLAHWLKEVIAGQ